MNSALNYRVVKSMQVRSFFPSYLLVYLDHSVAICCLCLLCLSSLVERGSGSRRSKRKSDDDSDADADSPKSKVKKKILFFEIENKHHVPTSAGAPTTRPVTYIE